MKLWEKTTRPMLPCDARSLLPHQPPMLMVDRLLWIKEDEAGAEFTPAPACPLLDDNGVMLPVGLIEVAAQACAAWQGFVAVSKGLRVRRGYLVGVDKFQCPRPAKVNETLISKLHLVADLDNFMAVDAIIENAAGHGLAGLRLKVFAS